MSQMVLPQNLSSKAHSEAANTAASSRPGDDKTGESSFDAVSRSEKERLEAKARKADAEKADSKKPDTEKPDAADTAKAGKSDESAKTADSTDPAGEKSGNESGQNIAAGKGEDGAEPVQPLSGTGDVTADPDQLAVDSLAMTFADLQSLVAGAQLQGAGGTLASGTAGAAANGTGTGPSGQALPFIQGSIMSLAGQGGTGKNGSMGLQAQNTSTSGMALTETLLAGVSTEAAKASESPLLQNAIRFQGAMESVNAQANAVNTPKMAPDAPVMRGYATSIDVPVGHAEWGDKMAGKLTWLTAANMSVAEIHLTPPDMGPMEVRVQVQNEQANITVHSANPAVRDQLELHSHRLRDMLSEQGLSLEQFDVSDSGRDQAGDGDNGENAGSGNGLLSDVDADETGAAPQSLDLSWKGEVDVFA
ncbi:flagellar hook-length control protein FliK [Marinobacter halotolerans]|uniref:flagellar hook-length control protein FliK n=1 Tax=Marinobacter halotolerans TaxID=1569211 RepID=UPI0012451F0D|nr:flagellar hook-length control protein FliK [Marinobacter halotolerans]